MISTLMLLALAGQAAVPPPAAPGPPDRPAVVLGCDAPTGHWCSYAVFYDTGVRGPWFTIPGGSRLLLPNVAPDFDRYIVVVDGEAPLSLDCNGAQAHGHFCKIAVLVRGYNN
jgi:hypothetical protein